jgi:hypothetical protein
MYWQPRALRSQAFTSTWATGNRGKLPMSRAPASQLQCYRQRRGRDGPISPWASRYNMRLCSQQVREHTAMHCHECNQPCQLSPAIVSKSCLVLQLCADPEGKNMCPQVRIFQCSVLLACTRAVTMANIRQVSQGYHTPPFNTSYHISARCRMLCKVLSSATHSNHSLLVSASHMQY